MVVPNFLILLTLITTISADDPTINSTSVENTTLNTHTTTNETTVTTPSETAGDAVGHPQTTEPSNRENQTDSKVTNQPETGSTIETATCALDQPHAQTPKEAISEEPILKEATPKGALSKKATSKEAIPGGTTPKEATSEEPTFKEATPKAATSKEAIPDGTTPEKNDPVVATSKEAMSDDTAPAMTEPPRKPSLLQRMKFHGQHNHLSSSEESSSAEGRPTGPVPCTCGVFLSGQFKKGSKQQPKGMPVLTQEMDTPFMNNAMGNRQCTNKCLELIIKHLPKSGEIICATVDREHVFKERAYLFIKNHSDKWHGTNLSAGREFCCRENMPYKCPVN